MRPPCAARRGRAGLKPAPTVFFCRAYPASSLRLLAPLSFHERGNDGSAFALFEDLDGVG